MMFLQKVGGAILLKKLNQITLPGMKGNIKVRYTLLSFVMSSLIPALFSRASLHLTRVDLHGVTAMVSQFVPPFVSAGCPAGESGGEGYYGGRRDCQLLCPRHCHQGNSHAYSILNL